MKKLLWQEVQKLLKAAGYDVNDYTAKQIRDFENIRWKDDIQSDVNSFLWFYKETKFDLEHRHGVFAQEKWLMLIVAQTLFEKRKQRIIGVYEVSNEIAHSAMLSAIAYVDGWSDSIEFSLAPTKIFTGEFSWRLDAGILPNRINGYTARRLHKVFAGYKIHLVRKRYKNGMGGRWIAGVRAVEEE